MNIREHISEQEECLRVLRESIDHLKGADHEEYTNTLREIVKVRYALAILTDLQADSKRDR